MWWEIPINFVGEETESTLALTATEHDSKLPHHVPYTCCNSLLYNNASLNTVVHWLNKQFIAVERSVPKSEDLEQIISSLASIVIEIYLFMY